MQAWSSPPAPFQSVTAMDLRSGRATSPRNSRKRLRCGHVEHNFLRVLGVRVALGRDFAPEDDVRGAPPVALISHALWVRRFGADPGADRTDAESRARVGRSCTSASSASCRPDFEMPFEAADILLPAQLRPFDPKIPFAHADDGPRTTQAGRDTRARGGDAGAAVAEAAAASACCRAAARMARAPAARPAGRRCRRVAWLLIGAVAVFLLIACVNVTNLMLARVGERRREFGVRAAIGAGRMRLARLALAESLLLSLAAGGIGLLVAFALLETFVAMAPPGIPGIADASLDLRVFVVAALLVALTGTAIGLWPAVSVFRAGDLHGLRSTATSSPGARPRLRFALVTTQIALTLALLGGSALLLRSLWNVVNVPLGFNAERVVTLTAGLGRVRYPTVEHRAAFLEELLARARAMPGVVAAAMSEHGAATARPGRAP